MNPTTDPRCKRERVELFHILKPPNPLFDYAQSDSQAERSRSLFHNLMTLDAQKFHMPLFRFYLIHNNYQFHFSHYTCFCPNIRIANADEWGTSNVIKLRLFHILKPPNPLFDYAQSDSQAERSRSLFHNLMTLGAQMFHMPLFLFYIIHNNCQFHLSQYKSFCPNIRVANADEWRAFFTSPTTISL